MIRAFGLLRSQTKLIVRSSNRRPSDPALRRDEPQVAYDPAGFTVLVAARKSPAFEEEIMVCETRTHG
jgi:hypothetical protein